MPVPTRLQRLVARVQRPVLLLMAAAIGASAVAKLYLLAKALSSGVYIGASRIGPARVYLLQTDPGHYWVSIAWDGVLSLVLLALAVALGWSLMALRKPK